MELAVVNATGKATSKKIKLDKDVFGIEPNDHAIYLDVKRYLNAQRQGTHKSKERADVKGSRRKIKKQKGTGTARAGDIKNPLFRGGGTVFGPEPRDYTIKLNKQVKRLARKSALTYAAKEDKIIVLDDHKVTSGKSKDFNALLGQLKVADSKTLMVVPALDKSAYLACRNLENHKLMVASDLNTYDILNCRKLIVLEGSLEVIANTLNK